MFTFLITTLVALVAASPDIGLQLRQQQQHQQQQQQQQGPTGYVYQAPQLQQQQGPTHQQQNEQNNQQYFNQQQQTFNLNQGVDLNMGFNNQDGLQINQGNQGVQNSFNTEPIITKDVYFHTAPEEDEQPSVQIQQQFVQPQKHYKIIFIKAPSSGLSQVTQQVPVYPQNEEKTIVYVLSKKEEAEAIVQYQTPAPLVPSKPEVFFIKYKTQKESNNQGNIGGSGIAASTMNTNTNTNSNTNSDSNSNSANSTPVKCTHGCPTNIGRPEQSIVSQKPNKNYLPPL